MDSKKKNTEDTLSGHKLFERGEVTITVGSLIDDESMFYNPYKESVTFETIGHARVISKDYVI